MKNNFTLSLCFILLNTFWACGDGKNSTGTNKAVDEYMRHQLNGDWHDSTNLRVWRFNYDSVYYYDRNKAFAYRLDSLKLSVKFDNSESFAYVGWITVEGDSLTFDAGDSKIVLYRLKKKTAADLDKLLKRTNR
ncbi:hypothetical protein ESA94_16130 [Lacibacter luteus]|uniref:Lipocalin-like domain-containing protein n=1 Tax=Lacibacter luteus TaxID=2508719 RepID=A0A4Q1CGL5_9BACT|nr:hypothetical protein [Lacibacter luteus]RXK58915.1 hypothetical protein ESA94_16130 [Lacibacter luteus]